MAKLRAVATKAMRDRAFSKALAKDVDRALARKKIKLSSRQVRVLKTFLKRKYRLSGLQLLTFVAILSYGRPVPPPPLWGKSLREFWRG